MQFPESELIINPDGSIYHLNLRPEHLAHTIITVGDPDRVGDVSKHFDRIEHKIQHREFVTHTGYIGSQRLSVVATGIGTDNIDIVLNELDALVNIDFATRTLQPTLTSLRIVRIGTAGSLQADLPIDSFLFSSYGLGMDGLLDYYDLDQTPYEAQLCDAFNRYLKAPYLPGSYVCAADPSLLEHIAQGYPTGITATCTGFYGPQGRMLRAKPRKMDLIAALNGFRFEHNRITNFEMETAGIYGMSRMLGHRALSCNALLANRITGEFSKNPKGVVDRLIQVVLERLLVG
jgi:uridine phosphorylase